MTWVIILISHLKWPSLLHQPWGMCLKVCIKSHVEMHGQKITLKTPKSNCRADHKLNMVSDDFTGISGQKIFLHSWRFFMSMNLLCTPSDKFDKISVRIQAENLEAILKSFELKIFTKREHLKLRIYFFSS